MKVLHLIPSYLPATDSPGPILVTHTLNKELVQQGVEVTVYTTDMDRGKRMDVSHHQVIDGVSVFYFPMTFNPWCYSRALHKVMKEYAKEFDLIHCTSVFSSLSLFGAHYAKRYRKPLIISPLGSLMKEPLRHHGLKKNLYLSSIEKRNLRRASAIHFASQKEHDEYLAASLPLKQAVIIPHGIDIESFQSRNVPRGTFREKFGIRQEQKIILFLGRLTWVKGLDTLLPAFREVLKREPAAVLVVAGPDEQGYKKEVQERVIFTGPLFGADKLAALKDADVFVLPSYSESFGMAVVEALVCGLPVVVTSGVGISGEIKEANAGIVVEKDVAQVADAIIMMLRDPQAAKEMGERGKELVGSRFSVKHTTNTMRQEYGRIIGEQKKNEQT